MAKRGGHEAAKQKIAAFEKKQREHVEYQPIGVRAAKRQAAVARLHRGLKPMRFVSLHHHSTYSFLDGFQLPEAHVRRATEIKMSGLAMTEHGNLFSHVKLEKAAEEQGVKPIFGSELYCGWTDEARQSQKKNHLTVIAKDAEGYNNLLTLTNRSWREGFYHDPTVDWSWLPEHQDGLVILSGCQGSALFTALVGGKHVPETEAGYSRALRVARWMADRFQDFYVEVQAFPELDKARRANPLLARIARAIHRPLVATMDCHYTAPEEGEVQQLLHACRPGEQRTLEQMEQDWGYDVPLCPPPTDKAIYRRLRATGLTKEQAREAILSTEEIAQACNVTLPRLERVEYPLPDGYSDPVSLWRDWLREGWRYRECDRLPKREKRRYKDQLRHEMKVIEAKGYVNYFLIVADAIRFAKAEQIPVGPARGSAAASLACYLLRITEINPMLYDNLVFERFIDWSRADMPDIDIDFATYGRPIVRSYLERKYGAGCVNNVGTFTMYKSKNALDDTARVYNVPKRDVETLKELLIERSSGDLRASATIEDTVDQFDSAYDVVQRHPELQYAMDLEGNAKAFGVHAAGLVVSSEPITNVTAILERELPKGSGNWVDVISMDKDDAERQGMDKLDFLALSTMDMIAEAMRYLDMTVEDLYAIQMDDEETIEGFREGDVVGIFQFDGRATRIVNGLVKPDSFHEIALLIALSRPGPLHNGAVHGYCDVKWRGSREEQIHPALDELTGDTNFQIIFQEQIMRIVRDIGGFDDVGTASIRKIIAKKKGEQEFNRKWLEFRDGALAYHERRPDMPPIKEETAARIWGMCITAGAYSFNAAHSTSYGKIAFWTMWFKRHHPAVFCAASLAKMPKGDKGAKHRSLMRDAVKHGIEVLPPALDSDANWRRESHTAIRAGWSQVPGIGEKKAATIADFIEERGGLDAWEQLAEIPGVGPKTIDTIVSFTQQSDPFAIHALDRALATVSASLADGIESSQGRLPRPTHGAGDIYGASGKETITFLGQPVHRNLRDMFEANQKKGIDLDPKTVKNPELSQWVVMAARDADELATFVFSRFKYPRFKDTIFKLQMEGEELVLIQGKKATKGDLADNSGVVFVDKMWVLEP